MRPMLKPALRRGWRDTESVQFGVDRRHAVVLGPVDGAVAGFLDLLDGTRGMDALVADAAALGLGPERVRRLLGELAEGGVLDDASAHAALSASVRHRSALLDRLRPDLAALSLVHPAPGAGPARIRHRATSRVRVLGAGRVGAALAAVLSAAGVGAVDLVDGGRVEPWDTGPCGIPADHAGERRDAAGRGAVRRAAGTAPGRPPGPRPPGTHPPGSATDRARARAARAGTGPGRGTGYAMPAGVSATPGADRADAVRTVPVAWSGSGRAAPGPADGSPVSADAGLAGAAHTRSAAWSGSDRAGPGPADGGAVPVGAVRAGAGIAGAGSAGDALGADVFAVVAPRDGLYAFAPDEAQARELVAAGVPHLYAGVLEGTGLVGPLVLPGRTGCGECLGLLLSDRDPAWPRLLAQLRSGWRPAVPACDVALATAVAGTAAGHVLAHLDGRLPPSTGARLELPSAGPALRVLAVPGHPGCGCGAAAFGARPPHGRSGGAGSDAGAGEIADQDERDKASPPRGTDPVLAAAPTAGSPQGGTMAM